MPQEIETETEKKVRLWEQHGTTLMLGVMSAALLYFANATVEAKTAQAATTAELRAVSTNLARLEGSVAAMQSQYITRAEMAVYESRLTRLEGKP